MITEGVPSLDVVCWTLDVHIDCSIDTKKSPLFPYFIMDYDEAVDMESPEPVKQAVSHFERLVDELRSLWHKNAIT